MSDDRDLGIWKKRDLHAPLEMAQTGVRIFGMAVAGEIWCCEEVGEVVGTGEAS